MGSRPGVPARPGFLAMIGAWMLLEEAAGATSYDSSAGYVSVHADGTVYFTSKSSGNFSGQVCFVA